MTVTQTGQTRDGQMRRMAFASAVATLGLASANAFAETPSPSRAQLVTATGAIRAGQPFWLAIHIQLDDGWHTYWRNPGDAGMRPQIRWQLPLGMEAEPISWPYPSMFREGPLVTYGYSGNAWLFTRMTAPAESGVSITIGADVEWLVCRDICIPQYAELMLAVPIAGPEEGSFPAIGFADALADIPQKSPWPAFYDVDSEHFVLTVRTPGLDAAEARFYPHDYGVIDHAADQQMSRDDLGLHVTVRRSMSGKDLSGNIAGALVVRDEDGSRAFEIIAVPAPKEDERG
ncbi:MAG: protein-disulfide reductase DsbD domain-containing protein [Hyphomicrobium sp.]|jgi:DsbC/DsbD-like thiol-disulfide interchange protein